VIRLQGLGYAGFEHVRLPQDQGAARALDQAFLSQHGEFPGDLLAAAADTGCHDVVKRRRRDDTLPRPVLPWRRQAQELRIEPVPEVEESAP